MTVRLGISVEGQTEELFVKGILAKHLGSFHVYATPVTVATSRGADGTKARGGGINIDRVSSEIGRLLQGYADGHVTTLYDFYGFEDRKSGETVDDLEARIAAKVRFPERFICYVQLHEFEGLLLSDPVVTANYFQSTKLAKLIGDAVSKAGTPESVNDGPQTAPSKRLEAWTREHSPTRQRYSRATKSRHGPQLAAGLTLPVIRRARPRFNGWVRQLEALAVRHRG